MIRRLLPLILFGLALVLGITAGVAQKRAAHRNESDFLTEWTGVLTRPFLTGTQSVVTKTRDIVGVFRLNSALKRDNKRLRGEVLRLRRDLVEVTERAREAEAVQKLAQAGERLDFSTVRARVLVRPATPWAESCTIDKGRLHGVRPAAAVLAAGGIVGQAVRIGDRTTQVMLLRDALSSVSCMVQRTGAPGICSGHGEESLVMEYIPLDADVARGDAIIASGEGEVFPTGLLVGHVEAVTAEPHSHFKKATVRPAVEFRSIEHVLVVTGSR